MTRLPHHEQLEQEVREVFLNAVFHRPEDCTDSLIEAPLCPGYVLVLHHDHDGDLLKAILAEDWTQAEVYTEAHLDANNPDWDRFRRWLWDACYAEVRQVVETLTKTLGISVPWPDPVVGDKGRKHFPGREPMATESNVFDAITSGPTTAHVIVGGTMSGKTTLALRVAVDAVTSGKRVMFASMEMTTATLAGTLARMGLPQAPQLTLKMLTGSNIGSVFKEFEEASQQHDVIILDSTFVKLDDQPKRLAMKTDTEVFIVQQATRSASGNQFMQSMSSRMAQTVDGVYWVERPGAPFRVVKHRSRAGVRILPSVRVQFVATKPKVTIQRATVSNLEDLETTLQSGLLSRGKPVKEIIMSPKIFALMFRMCRQGRSISGSVGWRRP